jgi:enamine deaminase RidA (YjgF/YER057c/UK114 family)
LSEGRKRIGDFSIGTWAGDTLFLSGVVGFDAKLGRVVEGYEDLPLETVEQLASGHQSIDYREGPIVAQAWVAYSLIEATLRSQELGLADVVKVTHYLTDFTDFPAYNRTRNLFLGEDPPASTVVEVAQLLPSPAVRLEVDVIASRGESVNLGQVGTDWRTRG